MLQPDLKLAALPTLPLPYYDQKVVIQFYKAAALKCRTQYKDWILHPKENVAKYVRALGAEEPEWTIMRYSHRIDGELQEVYRCRFVLPLQPAVTLHRDALLAKRADMTAALHALLYLLSKDLITQDGLPRLPPSPPKSSSGLESSSSSVSSSSGSSAPNSVNRSSAVERSFTSIPIARTIASSILTKPATSDVAKRRSLPSSTSSFSDTKDQMRGPVAGIKPTSSISSTEQGSIKWIHPVNKESITTHTSDAMNGLGSHRIIDASVRPLTKSPPSVQNEATRPSVSAVSLGSAHNIGSDRSPSPIAGPSRDSSPGASLIMKKQHSRPASPAKEPPQSQAQAGAPHRHEISLESARGFIDFYCSKYGFPRADIIYNSKSKATTIIEAIMFIGGNRVGTGSGCNMKEATSLCYIDACLWMSSCDDSLWYQFLMLEATNKAKETRATQRKNQQKADYVPSVELSFSEKLDAQLRSVIWEARKSELHRQALRSRARAEAGVQRFKEQRDKAAANLASKGAVNQNKTLNIGDTNSYTYVDAMKTDALANKSRELQDRQDRYRSDPRQAKMRETRASLPISNHARDLMKAIEENPVVVVMAQTGSGKTTQLPQIILDHYIQNGKGATCNVICTQPRRLAAISVAQRVATERGEPPGKSVGYQVRFENTFPERDGSILFMTSGIFLKRMQVGLEDLTSGKSSFLDEVSHIIVDEVHERDIDVDLLLFTLRRQLIERRMVGKPDFKVILMSATIDPSLFRNYFPDPRTGKPAPYLEIPGRTYPVKKFNLNEIFNNLQRHPLFPQFRWVLEEKEVKPYLLRELQSPLEQSAASRTDDDLKFSAPLIALVVAFVAQRTSSTRDGHILVFLPGLEEIKAIQKALLDSNRPLLNINFDQYEIHILHSEVPIAEQQLVFAPAARGLQRIILATNIAETSVTIPDVVYVVDAGKCKEKRFDPERHLSSLVQAFTGIGNMGQRAGRAGRHRPGEYFSLVSESRLACLPQNQTVEMKRLDLSNVVMHVKGLNLPMEVEDVLDDCIEPPGRERVVAAIKTLQRVGALDLNKNLTSLGKVLLHLPVEASIGKLVLLGCFFRCLDQVLAIAALLTNRDPFVAPIDKRFEANMAKKRFCPPGFTSDTLTSLKAYNEWASIPNFYDQRAFCDENFLSHGGLRTIEKLRTSLIQSLDRAGVLSLAAGGDRLQLQKNRGGLPVLPHFLNTNGENLPLLAALISCAVAPGFAIRKGPSLLRTPQDTSAMLHASSIATIMKKKLPSTSGYAKEIFAYTEAIKNVSKGGAGQTTGLKMNSQLRGVTLLDPLGLLLFGVHELAIARDGFVCDGWLPMAGKVDLLDDLQRFKDVLHASLLRAFEGLGAAMLARSNSSFSAGRSGEYTATDEYEDDPEDAGPVTPLSDQELDDLDHLAKNVVETLQQHALDNGLPPTHDLARIYSSEDDYIARQYPVRKTLRANTVKTSKKEERPSSEWDTWGELVPAQIPSNGTSIQRKEGDWPAQPSNNPLPDPNMAVSSERQQPKVFEPAADDGWGKWQPATAQNDAFDRRAAMRRRSSTTSSTFTVPRSGSPAARTNASLQPEANNSRIANHLSPPPKANGWIGTQNIDALRMSQRDGWSNYQEKGPTVMVSKRPDESIIASPMTAQRKPATYVDVPTSSGLPERQEADNSAHTTGWGPFDKYNPRTRSSQKSSGRSPVPDASLSPSYARHGPGVNDETAYPRLSGGASDAPSHRIDPSKSSTGPTSWDHWTPSRNNDGEDAYRGRMTRKAHVTSKSPQMAVRQPDLSARHMQDSPSARLQQERRPSAVSANVLVPPNIPSATETNVSEDPWAKWNATVPAEKQGEQNFQRRAAMSRGEYLPDRPAASAAASPSAQRSFGTASQDTAYARPIEPPATAVQQDDDPWNSYQPTVTAERQGNEAFERRRAMANGIHGTAFSNISVSNSLSSTSSIDTPFKTPDGLRPDKTMSIAGRANRENGAREAKDAKLAMYKDIGDDVSTLAKNFQSLTIAGSASKRSASTSMTADTSHSSLMSPASAKGTHAPAFSAPSPLQDAATRTYRISVRRPQGQNGNSGGPSQGFDQRRRNPLLPQSGTSEPASSDSGTFISERPINGHPTQQANSHTAHQRPHVPGGGIGWD